MAVAKKTVAKAKTIKAKVVKAKAVPAAEIDMTFVEKAREAIEDRAEMVTDRVKAAFKGVQGRVASIREGAEDVLGVVRSSAGIAGNGVREVNLAVLDMVHGDVTRFVAAQKKALKAESMKEALEIQAAYIRAEFQHRVKNVRAYGEMVAEHARDVFAPIREGVEDLAEKTGLKKAA
jgi:hypothetical protein